ncbi:uncharacterized protein pcare2 [Danio rerio]|uniref:Uncharacterized protein pcare2 n=1 Tax=Danio rerio TaxID=7955 RepID=A0ACD6B6U4_DANRE
MGCSPSKGQLFSKRPALPSGPAESKKNPDLLSDGDQIQSKAEDSEELAETEIEEPAKHSEGKRHSVDDVVCDATAIVREDAAEKILEIISSHDEQRAQETLLEQQEEAVEEKKTREKQVKRKKQRKPRLRKNSHVLAKAEFVLKAHQAAYAYLNPSISKYEALLGLLGQAAQTQRSLQTTVASVVLHFEEINQALEDLAADGEQLLREHGHNMTWPASFKDYPPTAANGQTGSPLPSELLQQMLLHSTVNMASMGDSVRCRSDSALQELAQYFGSMSELIGEKLLAKRAAEERLKQVLCHVEAAAFRKPGPEDSALHSEDSGIGAENDCQNGSDRQRRSRGSSGSGANAGITSAFNNSASLDQQHASEPVSEEDEDDEEDDEDAEPEEEVSGKDELEVQEDKKIETTYGFSEADTSRPAFQGGLQEPAKASYLKRKIRRPKTADNNTLQMKPKHRHLRGPKRSQSAECLCSEEKDSDPHVKLGYQRNQHAQHWRRKNCLPEGRVRSKIRGGSSGAPSADRYYGLQYGSKGPFRAAPPSSPPTFTPEPPGRNAVRRLINTFSQGVEDSSRQRLLDQRPVRARGHKKCSLPLLQNSRAALTTGADLHLLSDRPEILDLDSLPPPPPEMLMDSSYSSSAGPSAEEGPHEVQCRGQRTLTQRQPVPLSRANVQRCSISSSRPARQDAFLGSSIERDYTQVTEGENASLHTKCYPPTTPPVSRTRLPPSCPSVHHAVPSPPSTTWPPNGRWTPSAKPHTLPPGSQSYLEARAKFCQENQPWPPSCTSTLPRPWGDPARGRVSMGHLQPSGHCPQAHSEPLPDIRAQEGLIEDASDSTSDGTRPECEPEPADSHLNTLQPQQIAD